MYKRQVLVIGFGGAGGCAAIAAADEGAKVLLVDKAPQYLEGGNTRYSEQFLLGWEDEAVGYEFIVGMADGCQDMTDDILHLIAEETTKTPAWIEAHGGSVGVYNTTLPDRATFDKVFSTGNAPDLLMSDWVAEQSDGTYSFFEYNHWPNNGTLNDYQISHSYMVDNAPAHKGYWEWLRRTVESYSDSITCWFNAPAVKLLQDGATKTVTGAVVNHNGEEVRLSLIHICPVDANGDPFEGLYVIGDSSGSYFAHSYPNLCTGYAHGRTCTFARRVAREMNGEEVKDYTIMNA